MFWQPGAARPTIPLDRDRDELPVYNPLSGFSIDIQRRRLPIFEHRGAILHAISQNGVTIIVADVGAGKSTQIVQFLHESGWTADGFMVACTQPRRVAAKTVAARVAEEMGVKLGREVGYSIRFDDVSHPTATRIKFVTDGMLLREMLVDPLLRRYSVVMVDEAHERSLQSDVLMGLLRRVRRVRPTLRVVISSATLEADHFRDFFDATNDAADDNATLSDLQRDFIGDGEDEDDVGATSGEQLLQPSRSEASSLNAPQSEKIIVAVPPGVRPPAGAPSSRPSRWGNAPALLTASAAVSSASPITGSDLVSPALLAQALARAAAVTAGISSRGPLLSSAPNAIEQQRLPSLPVSVPDLSRAVVLAVEGKNYPVDVLFSESPVADVVAAAAETAINIHVHEPQGDVLIFLHGAEAIERCCGAIIPACTLKNKHTHTHTHTHTHAHTDACSDLSYSLHSTCVRSDDS
jgi:hypothetical protein